MNPKTVPPLSREHIVEQAIQMRIATQKDNCLVFPIVEIIEPVLECMNGSLEVVEDNELPSNQPAKIVAIPNTDNEIWPCINVIKVKESVYNGAILGNPEDRFTMAHELAHAFLFHGCPQSNINYTNNPKCSKEDPEWQADIFAINLLAPIRFFNGTNHEKIAKLCKVPLKYATWQNDFIVADRFLFHYAASCKKIHSSTEACADFISYQYLCKQQQSKKISPPIDN